MEIIAVLIFMVALCVGHYAVGKYRLPLYKRLAGWALIAISVVILGLDVFLAIDEYNNTPDIDTKQISERLAGVHTFPSLENMDENTYFLWKKQQEIEGYLDKYSTYKQEEQLYVTQEFVRIYGKDVARGLTAEQRTVMLEDTIAKYNRGYVDRIFSECLNPYEGNGSFNLKKGLGEKWSQYADSDTETKLNLMRSLLARNKGAMTSAEVLTLKLRRAFCVFVLLLGWGIYILLSKPIYTAIWLRIVKVICYVSISLLLFAVLSNEVFTRLIGLVAEFLVMALLLWLNLSNRFRSTNSKKM